MHRTCVLYVKLRVGEHDLNAVDNSLGCMLVLYVQEQLLTVDSAMSQASPVVHMCPHAQYWSDESQGCTGLQAALPHWT